MGACLVGLGATRTCDSPMVVNPVDMAIKLVSMGIHAGSEATQQTSRTHATGQLHDPACWKHCCCVSQGIKELWRNVYLTTPADALADHLLLMPCLDCRLSCKGCPLKVSSRPLSLKASS